jgi:large subunit ribosomal protein L3
MGHRKQHAPRHGSLSFLRRCRARYMKGRVRNWLDYEGKPKLLGFAGFKAGMTHLAYIEDQKTSPFFGKELVKAVTVVETPPIYLYGIKALIRDEYGLNAIGEVFAQQLIPELARKIQLPNPEKYNTEEKIKKLEEQLVDNMEIRALVATQPWKASMPRIKPDLIEIKVTGGANSKEQFEYAKGLLGKEVKVRDCIVEGSLIDSIAVNKGKGYQGMTKKFHPKLLPRKNRKGKRRIGTIASLNPAKTLFTIARCGQMGCHQRVEYHKRVMKISEDGDEINPKGGFIRYGLINSDYVLLLGSVPGGKKRLIRIRDSIRPEARFKVGIPEITYTSKLSQQGK